MKGILTFSRLISEFEKQKVLFPTFATFRSSQSFGKERHMKVIACRFWEKGKNRRNLPLDIIFLSLAGKAATDFSVYLGKFFVKKKIPYFPKPKSHPLHFLSFFPVTRQFHPVNNQKVSGMSWISPASSKHIIQKFVAWKRRNGVVRKGKESIEKMRKVPHRSAISKYPGQDTRDWLQLSWLPRSSVPKWSLNLSVWFRVHFEAMFRDFLLRSEKVSLRIDE